MKKIFVLFMVLSFNCNASLVQLGQGLIYDNVTDLTWVQDPFKVTQLATNTGTGPNIPGLLFSPTLTPDGRVAIGDPTIISNLNGTLLGPNGYLGVNTWRRPGTTGNTIGTTTGPGAVCDLCTLFANNTASDLALFTNVTNKKFWSGNQRFTNGTTSNNFALQFDTATGENFLIETIINRTANYGAVWAVTSGRVNVVPVPPAMILFLSALLGMILINRRQTQVI